jgi:hypothetical protein
MVKEKEGLMREVRRELNAVNREALGAVWELMSIVMGLSLDGDS